MRYGRYAWSHLFLRIGLGIVFIWMGVDFFRHPDIWIGYVPNRLPATITHDLALQLAGALDILIGTLLILGKFPRIAALLATTYLIGIAATQKFNISLVHDIGLLGMALGLLFWPQRAYRRSTWLTWGRRNSSSYDD